MFTHFKRFYSLIFLFRFTSGMTYNNPEIRLYARPLSCSHYPNVPSTEEKPKPICFFYNSVYNIGKQLSLFSFFLINQSIGKYLGSRVQDTFSSVSTLGMAFYNGWKMTLVVLAGLPVIGLANRIQQNEADATVEPEGVEAVSV